VPIVANLQVVRIVAGGLPSRRLLIQVLLERHEDAGDFFRPAQIGHGVGQGVVVAKVQQRRQFLLVELIGRSSTMLRMLRASTPVESFWDVVSTVGMVFSLS